MKPEQRDWKPRPLGFLAEHENIFEEERLDYIYELHNKMWQLVRIIRPGSQGKLKDVVTLILTAHTEPEDERKFATMEEVFPEFTAEDERYVPCPICGTHVCKSGICPQSDPHPKHANQIALQKYREYTGLHNVISPFEKWLQEDKC